MFSKLSHGLLWRSWSGKHCNDEGVICMRRWWSLKESNGYNPFPRWDWTSRQWLSLFFARSDNLNRFETENANRKLETSRKQRWYWLSHPRESKLAYFKRRFCGIARSAFD